MNSESKKIISIYNTILENKNLIKEVSLVKLKDTNYSKVKFDRDGTQNDKINKALLDDIQIAAENAGLTVTITTGVSDHNNTDSRHTDGNAVDISIINGINSNGATGPNNGNSDFRKYGNKLKDALGKLDYSCCDKEKNNLKSILWQTNTGGNHFNHLHISNTTDSADSSISNNPNSPTDTANNGHPDYIRSFFKDYATNLVNGGTPTGFGKLTEEMAYSKFGENIQYRNNDIVLPKNNNSKIKSPISGVVSVRNSSKLCPNKIVIKHFIKKDAYYLEYCGIDNVLVRDGKSIKSGDVIGKTNSDVSVSLFDNYKNPKSIEKHMQIPLDDVPPKDVPPIKGNDDDIIKRIISGAFDMFDRNPNVNPLKTGIFGKILNRETKLKENIERIKTLLK